MSEFLIAHDLPYRDSTEKAYSTDANIWGATHEAKSLEELGTSMDIVDPIMGVAHYREDVVIAAETVSIRFHEGWPVALNGNEFATQTELVQEANALLRAVRRWRREPLTRQVPGPTRQLPRVSALGCAELTRVDSARSPVNRCGAHRWVASKHPAA